VQVAPPFDEKYFDSVMDAFLSRDTNPAPPPCYKILTSTPYQPLPPHPPPLINLSCDSPSALTAVKNYQPKTLVARALKAEAAAVSSNKKKPIAPQPIPKKHATAAQKTALSAAVIIQGCLRRCFTQQFVPTPPVATLLRACMSEPPPPIDWHTVLKYERSICIHAEHDALFCGIFCVGFHRHLGQLSCYFFIAMSVASKQQLLPVNAALDTMLWAKCCSVTRSLPSAEDSTLKIHSGCESKALRVLAVVLQKHCCSHICQQQYFSYFSNKFRIFDVFERVLLGQQSMEVSLAGMALTYFPREILQCTLLKVQGYHRPKGKLQLLTRVQSLDISHNCFRAMPPIISLLLTRVT
jgi:hypothetical protein